MFVAGIAFLLSSSRRVSFVVDCIAAVSVVLCLALFARAVRCRCRSLFRVLSFTVRLSFLSLPVVVVVILYFVVNLLCRCRVCRVSSLLSVLSFAVVNRRRDEEAAG